MNVNDSVGSEGAGGKELCNLADGYSFVLQSVLGVLAFSTLIGECVGGAGPMRCNSRFFLIQ